MAQVTLPVGGVSYVVGCQDGEEDHLKEIASTVTGRLEEVRRTLAPSGDREALFLVALLMADDLYEARKKHMSDEERNLLERSRQVEAAYRQTSGRLADAADMATSLLQRVEDHLETPRSESKAETGQTDIASAPSALS